MNPIDTSGSNSSLISTLPHKNLGTIVTIPSYRENGIKDAVLSLVNCHPTEYPVEILVLINYPETCSQIEKEKTMAELEELKNWSQSVSSDNRKIFILEQELPEKFAGVGLARKILMDEAIRRFSFINKEGVIACYDADCACDRNYLPALERFFSLNKKAPGCSVYFEHEIENSPNPEAILEYELYLRYYIQGLRYSNFPFAFHTVGSAMAVRTQSYRQQGGMNKRKAAEDFHFLHKIIPMGSFSNLNSTRVIPSGRVSERVPFGTGKAMLDWASNQLKFWPAHPVETFQILKNFLLLRKEIYQQNLNAKWMESKLSPKLCEFLKKEDFISEVELARRSTTNYQTFSKAFFRWFNGLKVLKLANYLRDHQLGSIPVIDASRELLKLLNTDFEGTPRELLDRYRQLDRSD